MKTIYLKSRKNIWKLEFDIEVSEKEIFDDVVMNFYGFGVKLDMAPYIKGRDKNINIYLKKISVLQCGE